MSTEVSVETASDQTGLAECAEGPALDRSAQSSCLLWGLEAAQRLPGLPTALGTYLLYPEQGPPRRANALGLLKGAWTPVAHPLLLL